MALRFAVSWEGLVGLNCSSGSKEPQGQSQGNGGRLGECHMEVNWVLDFYLRR